MKPRVDVSGLKKTKFWEYALRFFFGGVITASAGLVSHVWGPTVAGLFLGFPAILPASLTLVNEHDGRKQAIDDARGARLGSVGMIGFATVVWLTARSWPLPVGLAVASAAWLVIDVGLWAVRHGRDPS